MITAPPDLPQTTILRVRPGHVVRMHARPGGRLLFRVLPKTVYGRRLILSVTQRRGAWAAVPTFLVPNGHRAWVRVSRRTFVVRRSRWRLSADLSARTVTVLHGAQRVRTLLTRDFEQAFQKVDAIVTPTAPTPAFKLGEKSGDPLSMYLADIYTVTADLAGIPGISVPCGQTQSGLPIGLQVLGRHFDESTVLRVAAAVESNS